MLKQLARSLSLTDAEIKIFLFLIILISTGIIYKHLNSDQTVHQKIFDYSKTDSLFRTAGHKNIPPAEVGKEEKKFDYKQEVLDFNTQNLNKVKPKKTAAEKSINLNKAGKDDLMTVPGLGEVTAEKILEHRSLIGSFTSLDQLKDVKGIGEKKFNKIKNYIFIE
jgi:competence ComEA-like helix-hairpin-helix protein